MDHDVVDVLLATFGFILFFAVIVGLCVLLSFLIPNHEDRIRKYIQSRGGRMISCHRKRSFWSSNDEPTFEVCYVDAAGEEHRVTCKTSFYSDIYFTGDCIIAGAKPTPPPLPPIRPDVASLKILQEENRQLREEIRRLKSMQDTR